MNFLRRKASRVGGEGKSNKNNAKVASTLAVIEDNEPQKGQANKSSTPEVVEASFSPTRDRRPSVAETIDSTSTGDSKKKKESYRARLAAESQASPQLQPWMMMSGTSHHTMTMASKPKAKSRPSKPNVDGSLASARTSVDSVPASIASSVPASTLSLQTGESAMSASNIPSAPTSPPPNVPYSAGPSIRSHSPINGSQIPLSPSYPPPRGSLLVPPSPTVRITPPSLPPKPPPVGPLPPPPMPSTAPPPPPPPVPVTLPPIGPLANPFRTNPPVLYTETMESSSSSASPAPVSPVLARPPPPPPPPPTAPKLQRVPSRSQGPPPSAFSKHKRSLSGRVSPSPNGLPSLPVPPPPPPPAPAPSNSSQTPQSGADSIVSPLNTHIRQDSLSAFPEPPSSTRSPSRTQTWDGWIPDPTGYYGGPASFVVEMDSIAAFPEPPSGNQNFQRQELESATPSQEQQMQDEEDLREMSKVFLPEGVLMHPSMPTPSDTSTSRKESVFSYVPPSTPNPSSPLTLPTRNRSDTQPKMTDGIFLSNSEHASLLSELTMLRSRAAELKTRGVNLETRHANLDARRIELETRSAELEARNADLEKQNIADVERINEWENYKISVEKYTEQMGKDRQSLIDKLQNSAQAHAAVMADKEQRFATLNNQLSQVTNTVRDWQNYSQRIEAERAETVARLTNDIERLQKDHAELIQALEISHRDDLDKLQVDHNIERDRLNTEHASERDRLHNTMNAARAEYDFQRTELMSQVAALDAQNKELTPRMAELDGQRRNLQGELVGCKADLEEWKTQVNSLTAAKNSIVKELQATKAKLMNVTGEANKAKASLEEMQLKLVELAEVKEKIERMKESEISLEKFLQTATDEKDKLKELYKQSQVKMGRLGTSLTSAEQQVSDRDQKIERLEKSNEAMKKRVYLLGQRMAEKTEWWQGQVSAQPQATAT
ncbi:hypothetical protein H072_4728 [Dactylellina haptotyla CBS 200.50]|uniref:Uncharacterized protein n=1 Tax=Dactylellina haptotyla (strain CBS 200.50) TaxID=1284197 RepID=S8AEE0_DACHA|nr:hypothetical protein H072_4728 [Dactylellina haptotyla CBS 200.50]